MPRIQRKKVLPYVTFIPIFFEYCSQIFDGKLLTRLLGNCKTLYMKYFKDEIEIGFKNSHQADKMCKIHIP